MFHLNFCRHHVPNLGKKQEWHVCFYGLRALNISTSGCFNLITNLVVVCVEIRIFRFKSGYDVISAHTRVSQFYSSFRCPESRHLSLSVSFWISISCELAIGYFRSIPHFGVLLFFPCCFGSILDIF